MHGVTQDEGQPEAGRGARNWPGKGAWWSLEL